MVTSEKTSDEYLEVNACGIEYISDIDRGSYRPQGRCDYHILYVERGVCNMFIDDGWQKLSGGSFVLFRPHESQRYFYTANDDSISHYIHFTGTGCEQILKKLGIFDIKVFDIGKCPEYKKMSAELVCEFTMRKPMYREFCNSLLYKLLCIVGRKYALRTSNVNFKSEERISAACNEIYNSIKLPPSSSDLAKKSFLSVSRFLHLFKEVTGKSYVEFVTFIRMEKAKELLVNTDMQISSIANALGYEDQNYFSRCFHKTVGYSPIEYRKENK